MKTARDWLDDYARHHRHPLNRRCHYICIPVIVLAVICGLKAVSGGAPGVDGASVAIALALLYYAWLSWRCAIGLGLFLAACYGFAVAVEAAAGPRLPWLAATLFVAGWIGQFLGHRIEGSRPAFFKDLQFLLIGPLWEMAGLYERLGIPVVAGRELTASRRGAR